jgi:hypothetical protein
MRRYIIYFILDIIAASSSLAIIKDRDTFFSCPARIKALSIAFLVFRLIPARAVDRFLAVYLIFAKSRV